MGFAAVDPSASLSRLERWLSAGLLAGVGLLVAWNLDQDHRTVTEGQRKFIVAQANAVADTLQRELGIALAGMRPLREDIQLSPPALWPRLWARPVEGVGRGLVLVRTLMLFDAAGAVVIRGNPTHAALEQALPGPVRQATGPAASERVRTVAVPPGTPNGLATLLLGLELREGEGPLVGMLVAEIDPVQLPAVLHAVRHSADTFVALAHGQGRLLASDSQRPVTDPRGPGEPGSFFQRHLDSGQALTVMTGRPLIDATEQLMVQRLVIPDAASMDHPLVLALSRSLDAIYAPWRKRSPT